MQLDPNCKYIVEYEFGVSNRAIDGDNCIKIFQDAMCEKYGINDNKIYDWIVRKRITDKGREYIKFNIQENEKI